MRGRGSLSNRHDFTIEEIDRALQRPVVRRLLELVRLRNDHPAFSGTLIVETQGRSRLRLTWRSVGSACSLDVDLATGHLVIDVDGG